MLTAFSGIRNPRTLAAAPRIRPDTVHLSIHYLRNAMGWRTRTWPTTTTGSVPHRTAKRSPSYPQHTGHHQERFCTTDKPGLRHRSLCSRPPAANRLCGRCGRMSRRPRSQTWFYVNECDVARLPCPSKYTPPASSALQRRISS